ncbi:hypothetical protein [Xanthomonas sp. CFBP 7698]|uniref:hypothetical protein n=1 Tax=Xanthomonas sp. CFBP 7698 TaxID=2082399 RepID=UPI000EE58F27|nr:hypothetical protein [Xanthomonas sp. CFBP 7698]RJS04859.1 hypothetical protein XnspCFBP7698_00940 [Xanthomonas sp. CFBP 7698]
MRCLALSLLLMITTAAATEQRPMAAVLTEESIAGESRDAFIVRIAPQVMAQSVARSEMLCGEVVDLAGGYRVAVTSSGDPHSCDIPSSAGVYLHTHLAGRGFAFSLEDYRHPGYLITEIAVKYQAGERAKTLAKLRGRRGVYTVARLK